MTSYRAKHELPAIAQFGNLHPLGGAQGPFPQRHSVPETIRKTQRFEPRQAEARAHIYLYDPVNRGERNRAAAWGTSRRTGLGRSGERMSKATAAI